MSQEQYEFHIGSRIPEWKKYGRKDFVVLTIQIRKEDYRILTKYTLKQINDMSDEEFKRIKRGIYSTLYAVVRGRTKKCRIPFRKVEPKPPEIQG